MKISIPSNFIGDRSSWEERLKMMTAAGFDATDYSLTGKSIPWGEGIFTDASSDAFAEYFRNIAKAAAEHGVEIVQTHAPYCRPFCCEPEAYSAVLQQTVRAVHATGYLNCPYIVAHPVLHPDFNNGQNREQAIQANLKYFSALVPALKEAGVVMCIENLYYGLVGQPKIANACSDAEQLVEVIDTLNNMHGPYFAACLDTGHAMASGNDPIHMLKMLGDRTRTLHLHDSWGLLDDHLFPCSTDVMDWREFSRTLGQVGYRGAINSEVIIFQQNLTDERAGRAFIEASLDILVALSRSIIDLAESVR